MLYLLLMEQRYGTRIERGLLQYLNAGPPEVCLSESRPISWQCVNDGGPRPLLLLQFITETYPIASPSHLEEGNDFAEHKVMLHLQVITMTPFEVSALIMQRNLLASHLSGLQQLPPMIQNEFTCKYCSVQTACTLFHKVSLLAPQVSRAEPQYIDAWRGYVDIRTKPQPKMVS